MKKFYPKLRVMLVTFAFGLASVSMFEAFAAKYQQAEAPLLLPAEVSVDLPKTESESVLIVVPQKK